MACVYLIEDGEGGVIRRGEIPTLVHIAGALLAAGPAGADSLSAGVAASAALPDRRHGGGRCAAIAVGDRDPARTAVRWAPAASVVKWSMEIRGTEAPAIS